MADERSDSDRSQRRRSEAKEFNIVNRCAECRVLARNHTMWAIVIMICAIAVICGTVALRVPHSGAYVKGPEIPAEGK
jgi:hypothetical protein